MKCRFGGVGLFFYIRIRMLSKNWRCGAFHLTGERKIVEGDLGSHWKLDFLGSNIASGARSLPFREFGDALELTEVAGAHLVGPWAGKNG
jgi:hypothetical protein